jgi:hypothetical protein
VEEGSTVILEQPEIHLHPLAQASLADVFVYVAEHRGIQVIVESHSEHLLMRLQRRIADETISNNAMRLMFADVEDGRSKLVNLELHMYGVIRNWPNHFMGDAVGELEAAAKFRAVKAKK